MRFTKLSSNAFRETTPLIKVIFGSLFFNILIYIRTCKIFFSIQGQQPKYEKESVKDRQIKMVIVRVIERNQSKKGENSYIENMGKKQKKKKERKKETQCVK